MQPLAVPQSNVLCPQARRCNKEQRTGEYDSL
jgi:hypothetical protein